MIKEARKSGTDSFGPWVENIYLVGKINGREVLVKRRNAWYQDKEGKEQISYYTQLRGDCVWIGLFKTMTAAVSFYL
jgi:hypothetical protein